MMSFVDVNLVLDWFGAQTVPSNSKHSSSNQHFESGLLRYFLLYPLAHLNDLVVMLDLPWVVCSARARSLFPANAGHLPQLGSFARCAVFGFSILPSIDRLCITCDRAGQKSSQVVGPCEQPESPVRGLQWPV